MSARYATLLSALAFTAGVAAGDAEPPVQPDVLWQFDTGG